MKVIYEDNHLLVIDKPVNIPMQEDNSKDLDLLNMAKQFIKVKYNKTNRRDIMEICNIMQASIVDMSKTMMMIQICDSPEKIKLMLSMLNEISIVEVARTGTLALPKCNDLEN